METVLVRLDEVSKQKLRVKAAYKGISMSRLVSEVMENYLSDESKPVKEQPAKKESVKKEVVKEEPAKEDTIENPEQYTIEQPLVKNGVKWMWMDYQWYYYEEKDEDKDEGDIWVGDDGDCYNEEE